MKSIITDYQKFIRWHWPELCLYDKQAEVFESVLVNEETVVPAGNDLGKDFIAGLISVYFQCSRYPCRIVSTSSSGTQLKSVLWGEIGRFLTTSKYPLPIEENVMWLRTKLKDGTLEPRSYHRGITAALPETLQGHHIEWGNLSVTDSMILNQSTDSFKGHHLPRHGTLPRTLAIIDEASGVAQPFYDAMDTWAHRKLIIGNPLPCTMFRNLVEGGDVLLDEADSLNVLA